MHYVHGLTLRPCFCRGSDTLNRTADAVCSDQIRRGMETSACLLSVLTGDAEGLGSALGPSDDLDGVGSQRVDSFTLRPGG